MTEHLRAAVEVVCRPPKDGLPLIPAELRLNGQSLKFNKIDVLTEAGTVVAVVLTLFPSEVVFSTEAPA